MRDNYEQLVKAHQSSTMGGDPGSEMAGECPFVPSEVKFKVFQMLMDSLFMSFNEKVSMNNFQELSRCVISWLEEQCTPHMLQDLMLTILERVKMESAANSAPLESSLSENTNSGMMSSVGGEQSSNTMTSLQRQQHLDPRLYSKPHLK